MEGENSGWALGDDTIIRVKIEPEPTGEEERAIRLTHCGLLEEDGTIIRVKIEPQEMEENIAMLEGHGEELQNPQIEEHRDVKLEPDDEQGRQVLKEAWNCSFQGSTGENLPEEPTHPLSSFREKEYECDYCKGTFFSLSGLTVHKRLHTGEKPFKCPECGKSFRSSNHVQSHWRSHSKERPFLCTVCDQSFASHLDYSHHRGVHKGQKPFACSRCQMTFGTRFYLTRHQQEVHGEQLQVEVLEAERSRKENMFRCRDCPKIFTTSTSLSRHQLVHKSMKSLECPECQKTFIEAPALLQHWKMHSKQQLFICITCGQSFFSRGSLIAHSIIHVGLTVFPCLSCGRSFKRKKMLLRHQELVHSGINSGEEPTQHQSSSREKVHECCYCGISFSTRTQLTKHRYIHKEKKTFKCPECKKIFAYSTQLRRHWETHNSGRPFLCYRCGQSFLTYSALFSHRGLHRGEKPFTCSHCHRRFGYRFFFMRHLRVVHSDDGAMAEVNTEPQDGEEERRMLEGCREQPQNSQVEMDGDAQPSPGTAHSSPVLRRPHQCLFQETYNEDLKEEPTQPRSGSKEKSSEQLGGKKSEPNQCKKLHVGEKPFKCPECSRSFSSCPLLMQHWRTHSKKKPFHCFRCGRLFSSSSDFARHHRAHKGKLLYRCSVCRMIFRKTLKLLRHQIASHSGDGTIIRVKTEPEPTGEEERVIRLTHCGVLEGDSTIIKVKIEPEEMEEDRMMLKGPGEELQNPQVKVYPEAYNKQRGRGVLREAQNLSFQGPTSENLEEEPTEEGRSSREKVHNHFYLFRRFGSVSTLIRRSQVPTAKLFKCPRCGKSFGFCTALLRHWRSHHKEKPFLCFTCGRCFSSHVDLLSHRLVHKGEKPFACSRCPMTFGMRFSLMRHRRLLHNGDDPVARVNMEPQDGEEDRVMLEGCREQPQNPQREVDGTAEPPLDTEPEHEETLQMSYLQ